MDNMKKVGIRKEEFESKLRRNPRLGEEYIKNIDLPQAFSSGNKFLRNYILEKSTFKPEMNLPSDWFQFSQLVEEIKVDSEKLTVLYDPEKESHPPFMARSQGI